MNTKQIDLLNIGLIFLSLIVAINLPFHLFLFSYAILGPLHYLTEINWLNKQNFFSSVNKKWSIIFIVLALVICIPSLLVLLLKPKVFVPNLTNYIIKYGPNAIPRLFAVAFITALGFAFLKKWIHLVLLFIASVVISYFLLKIRFWVIMFGIMLPTLLHVFVFTLFFMWYGAIKSKSLWGYLGIVALVASVFIIASINVDGNAYMIPQSIISKYFASNIHTTLGEIAFFSGLAEKGEQIHLFDNGIVKIQMFISFAYTYHYLNWFSKTSVIKWHLITRKETIAILLIWLVSISLYIYDFQLGFTLLLFISILHVFLEFPLNFISIAGTLKNYFPFGTASVAKSIVKT